MRWSVPGVCGAGVGLGLALAALWRPGEAPAPASPVRAARSVALGPVGPSAQGGGLRERPAAAVRTHLTAGQPSTSWVGAVVQDAMRRDGDSDPRLLGALASLGLHPAALAPIGGVVDPWLAVGLWDLERQVADHCAGCGWDAAAAADALLLALTDPGPRCVVAGLVARDPTACGGDGSP